MTLPIIKAAPWYMGQFGVFGSDSPRGIRWRTDATTWFVDNTHPGCSDDNMGTDPEAPLATITAAVVNRVGDAAMGGNPYDVIVVGGTGYTESVIVAPTYPMYCTILGAGGTDHRPTWTAATAAGTALTIRQEGWTVEGFTFETGAAGTGIRVEEVTVGSYTAYKATIRNCRFDGLYGGLYGIDFIGAPHRVSIENCMFLEYRQSGNAYAIMVSDTATGPGSPYQGTVAGCRFQNCDNYVGGLNAIVGFNMTLFQGNAFFTSHAALIPITGVYLDLRGGSRGYNIVTGNYFGGVYTNAGGYWANPATPNTCWIGNLTEPTPGTVADNGWTVQVPA